MNHSVVYPICHDSNHQNMGPGCPEVEHQRIVEHFDETWNPMKGAQDYVAHALDSSPQEASPAPARYQDCFPAPH